MSQVITNDLKVVCQICGLEAEMLTTSHFKHKHGLSFKDYRLMFPDAPTMTAKKQNERRAAISRSTKGRVAHNKGVPASVSQKEKASATKKAQFAEGNVIHWNTGKSTSQITRDKISASIKEITRTDEELELANDKRRQTIKQKVIAGWESPLKGRVLSGKHLEQSRSAIRKASDVKSQQTWNDIQRKCIDYSLSIVERLPDNYINLECNICKTSFTFHFQMFRNSKTIGHKICPTCYPRLTGTSLAENELAEFIESLGVPIIRNDRCLLGYGQEVDILIPSLKLAIEYDGLYWHSSSVHGIPKNVSVKTTKLNNLGYRTIHVFEDEWINKKDIVKSRLQHLIGSNSGIRVHARKMDIRTINSPDRDKFLNENHIQGDDIAKIRYGAYFNDELLAVMTFKPTNFVKGGNGNAMELSRFSVKIGYHIPGIAGKLFKHFKRNHKVDTVISYSDRRWSIGNVYKSLGFKYSHTSVPNYWYFLPNIPLRLHRSGFMKHQLVENGFDYSKSEFEIMDERGYYRIYDAGTDVWIFSDAQEQ